MLPTLSRCTVGTRYGGPPTSARRGDPQMPAPQKSNRATNPPRQGPLAPAPHAHAHAELLRIESGLGEGEPSRITATRSAGLWAGAAAVAVHSRWPEARRMLAAWAARESAAHLVPPGGTAPRACQGTRPLCIPPSQSRRPCSFRELRWRGRPPPPNSSRARGFAQRAPKVRGMCTTRHVRVRPGAARAFHGHWTRAGGRTLADLVHRRHKGRARFRRSPC